MYEQRTTRTLWCGCWRLTPLPAGRSLRVTALLAVVFVLSTCDLALTQLQVQRGNFVELNLLAAQVLPHGLGGMAAYKAVLLGLGGSIIYHYRRRRAAEASAWLLAACHVGLLLWWQQYLALVEICANDPFCSALPGPF